MVNVTFEFIEIDQWTTMYKNTIIKCQIMSYVSLQINHHSAFNTFWNLHRHDIKQLAARMNELIQSFA